MPKHKKADTSSDSDSGPEDRNPPAKKHAPGKSKSSEPPDEQGWHIGNNRFANVREFKGKIMVDIREYYEKDGELKPGKKGISMNTKQWQTFKGLVETIDKKVSEMA